MPGSSIFILLLVFDHLSVQIALSKNEWFYQYSQQNIFGFISVRSTATNLESLVSWPWDTTFQEIWHREWMKSIYYLEQLYTLEKKKKKKWVTDSNFLVAPDEIMQS